MKKIFTLSALSLMALAANAQITLNQAGYAAWTPGTSTFRGVTNFTATPANSGSWDLSGATYGSAFTQTRTALTMPGLPQVTFGEASVYGSGTFSYATSVGEGITVDGYQRFGESLDRQAIPLGSLTGDTDDSLCSMHRWLPIQHHALLLHFRQLPIAHGALTIIFRQTLQ